MEGIDDKIILPLSCYLILKFSKGHLFILFCGKLPKSLRLLTSKSYAKPFSFLVKMTQQGNKCMKIKVEKTVDNQLHIPL